MGNKALALKKAAREERRESLSIYTLITMRPVWKTSACPWLKEADSQALQMTLRNLGRAYPNVFAKRARFPRFKKKPASHQAFGYPQRLPVLSHAAFLPKIGAVKAVVPGNYRHRKDRDRLTLSDRPI